MSGKRKRGEESRSGTQTPNSGLSNGKPMSAIAAAKLRASGAANINEIKGEPSIPLDEPVESDYEESEPEEEEAVTVKQNFKLCNWQNEARNIKSDTKEELIINLEKHSTIALIGCYTLKVLKGAININGANLSTRHRQGQTDEYNNVFVPSTHPISKIRGLDNSNQVQLLHYEASLTLFGRISPLFADVWNMKSNGRSFDVIKESDADILQRSISPELAPEDWIRTIDDCAGFSSTTLITGPACSGKSTLARRLLNRYLTGFGKTFRAFPAVYYLDLDPSKPEYAPHGQVSLVLVREVNLGPSFTHPATIPGATQDNESIRAHSLPVTDLANYEEYYISCIEDLLRSYKTRQQHDPTLPLIINTPPSLYTTQFDILLRLIPRIKAQHVIHLGNKQCIDPDIAAKFDALQTVCHKNQSVIHELGAQAPLNTQVRSDSELRAMHMQSYFHMESLKYPQTGRRQWTWDTKILQHMTPWEFTYDNTDTISQDFTGFLMMNEPVEPSHLLTALNGSIVQLVESTSSRVTQAYISLPRTNKFRLPYFPKDNTTGMVEPLDCSTSKLICTALIRGFDPERRVVQVLVPKTQDVLLYNLTPERTVLVGGCCDMPEWAYLEDAYEETDTHSAVEPRPWVEKRAVMDGMGYFGTVRRVRKFQQGERAEESR